MWIGEPCVRVLPEILAGNWQRRPAEVTAARVLAHACDQLAPILDDYRCRVLVRLTRERRADPF
jgi:hypothetical protein